MQEDWAVRQAVMVAGLVLALVSVRKDAVAALSILTRLG
jgi:hypothetical protein